MTKIVDTVRYQTFGAEFLWGTVNGIDDCLTLGNGVDNLTVTMSPPEWQFLIDFIGLNKND